MSQDSVKDARRRAHILPKTGLRIRGAASIKVCITFLIAGIVSLVLSVLAESNTIALIGLGLTFWGALFLFISPKRKVDGRLLYDSVLASYSTLDRIIADFKYKGKGYYLPPYPKDVYLPEHLKGLKDISVFISAEDKFDFPSIEEIAESKFLLKNPNGILIAPPGIGFLDQMERVTRVDFAKTSLDMVAEIVPRSILEHFDLAEDLTITVEGNQVKMLITDSLYHDLYAAENKSRSISILGCPIASTMACVLAKATGKPVAIQAYKKSPDGPIVQIQYRIEPGLTT